MILHIYFRCCATNRAYRSQIMNSQIGNKADKETKNFEFNTLHFPFPDFLPLDPPFLPFPFPLVGEDEGDAFPFDFAFNFAFGCGLVGCLALALPLPLPRPFPFCTPLCPRATLGDDSVFVAYSPRCSSSGLSSRRRLH